MKPTQTETSLSFNKKLLDENDKYGKNGALYVDNVVEMVNDFRTDDVLDYGCGLSFLANQLPFPIKQYDPAIEKFSSDPEPSDIVVCTEVIEYVRPCEVSDVVSHLHKLTKLMLFCVINLKDTGFEHFQKKSWNIWLSYFHAFSFVYAATKDDKIYVYLKPEAASE